MSDGGWPYKKWGLQFCGLLSLVFKLFPIPRDFIKKWFKNMNVFFISFLIYKLNRLAGTTSARLKNIKSIFAYIFAASASTMRHIVLINYTN